MNNFALEIFDDEGRLCTFYTVRKGDDDWTETDKFFSRFRHDSKLKPSSDLLLMLLNLIRNTMGAQEGLFRFENDAQALPPKDICVVLDMQQDDVELPFPLRLYCLRLSDSLVVLFNGGQKTSRAAQDGDTSMSFREANNFAQRILDAIREGDFVIAEDGRTIEHYDGSDDALIIY